MKQEWLLCDLHTHSYYSRINKPNDKSRVKEMNASEFVNILANKNVRLFSITDHNYFSKEYYDEIEKYIETENLDMKIINGVELDAYVQLNVDGQKDYIHICIYFEDSVDRQCLEKTINSLYRDDNGSYLKPLFSDIINKLYDLNSKFIIIPHGDKKRGIFNIVKLLSQSETIDFYKYAMYKIFNAFDVRPNFFEKSETFWAKNFYEKTTKFEKILNKYSPKKINTIENNITQKIKYNNIELTKEENEIYEYILKYGSYFAYFSFSDWHNAEPYTPRTNNFIFGDLALAFESFEMATLDPISRIEQSKDDKIEIPPTILQKVSFTIKGEKKEINFSPGLNAIVGKRGSGKSLLLAVIKNLVERDSPDGALTKYKNLKIDEISGENRGGINLSLGSLNSVAFLTQEQIKEIFENPQKAENSIANYFLDIKDIDLSGIKNIINVGKNIIPYNRNYKNLTSNILSIKKTNDFNYTKYDEIKDIEIKYGFNNLINELKSLSQNIETIGLNNIYINSELKRINRLKDYYLKLIELNNSIITNNNNRIDYINSKKTSNQISIRQNINDINNAIKEIKNNLHIQLNVEKLKIMIEKFKIDNPPVELFRKSKYLFVTYYEIPENINEIILEKITATIYRAREFEDIYKYINGDEKKKLNSKYINIMDELTKYLNDDIFKSKKEFYEIKNSSLDYKTIIKNMNDLNEHLKQGNISNLTDASPGMKSVAYLDMLFDLEDTILILDQPEDNIDNDYISKYLVPNIKEKKRVKQLIFVTHNPSVAVYGDAFNYIYAENNDSISYTNYLIEKKEDKEKLISILEGGRVSFSNRNKKFGNVLGEEEYGNS